MDARYYLSVIVACLAGNLAVPLLSYYVPAMNLGFPLGIDQALFASVIAVAVFTLVDRFLL